MDALLSSESSFLDASTFTISVVPVHMRHKQRKTFSKNTPGADAVIAEASFLEHSILS